MSSEVWLHFKIDSTNSCFAKCNICEKLVSRGGSSKTTSNVLKHIKSQHKSFLTKKSKPNEESRPKSTSNISQPCSYRPVSQPGTFASYFNKYIRKEDEIETEENVDDPPLQQYLPTDTYESEQSSSSLGLNIISEPCTSVDFSQASTSSDISTTSPLRYRKAIKIGEKRK